MSLEKQNQRKTKTKNGKKTQAERCPNLDGCPSTRICRRGRHGSGDSVLERRPQLREGEKECGATALGSGWCWQFVWATSGRFSGLCACATCWAAFCLGPHLVPGHWESTGSGPRVRDNKDCAWRRVASCDRRGYSQAQGRPAARACSSAANPRDLKHLRPPPGLRRLCPAAPGDAFRRPGQPFLELKGKADVLGISFLPP